MNKLFYIHKREYDSLMEMHRLLPLGAICLKYMHINKRRMIIYISYDFIGIKLELIFGIRCQNTGMNLRNGAGLLVTRKRREGCGI